MREATVAVNSAPGTASPTTEPMRRSIRSRRSSRPFASRFFTTSSLKPSVPATACTDSSLAIEQHHRQAKLFRQGLERGEHCGTFVLVCHHFVRAKRFVGDVHSSCIERFPRPLSAPVADGVVARDPPQPRAQFSRIFESIDLLPSRDECLLRRILSRRKIAQHCKGYGGYHALMPRYDIDEGLPVSTLSCDHQLRIVAIHGAGHCF